MTLPAFILGLIISTLYGAAFHLWKNGGFFRLVLYLILAWSGFWAGHILDSILEISFIRIGPLNLGTASIVSILLLFIGYWLTPESAGSQ